MIHTLCFRPRGIWLALLAFCGMLSFAAVASPAGTIVDNAHIFSAVTQAQQVIDQIRIRHSKDLSVETIASVPADQRGALEAQGKDAFFEQWAHERAKAMGTNGVYVLICMEPRHLQVEVGNRTATREFTIADREALRVRLVAQFKAQQYDAGLTDAANLVLERMDANTRQSSGSTNQGTGIGQSAPTYTGGSTGGGGVHFGGWICMGIAVLFLVMIFLRRGSGSGPNYPMNPGGQMGWGGGGGGGGGFGRGLLGGLLGGALGSWGYDRFARGGGFGDSSSSGPDTTGGFSGSSGTDSSFSGSGGDFSGGDSGGGGGGGDSGGGGGDF